MTNHTRRSKNKLGQLIAIAMIGLPMLGHAELLTGNNLHSTQGTNPNINALFAANRGTNAGDQSLQFGDILQGAEQDDVLIGGLGVDVLFGALGNDILVGGPEGGNPANSDRGFGEDGNDAFVWAPGDGNDFFDGGDGDDTLFISLILKNDTGDVLLDQASGRPEIDLVNTPGFCEIVENTGENQQEMTRLGLDHLVRFIARAPNAAFEQAVAANPDIDVTTLDTGLRITMHLKNVEFLACGGKTAKTIEVYDLRQSPPQLVDTSALPSPATELATDIQR